MIGVVVLDEMRRLALFTSGVAELTRNRAEQIVKTMMSDTSGAGASAMVRQLVETSRHNRQELLRLIGAEIRDQVESLGLATARDLERIERRVDRLEERARSAGPGAARKSKAKKSSAGKSSAKKSSAGKSSAKKSSAKSKKKTGASSRRSTSSTARGGTNGGRGSSRNQD